MEQNLRRDFLKKGLFSSLVLAIPGYDYQNNGKDGIQEYLNSFESKNQFGQSDIGLKVDPIPQLRIGIIGLGNRGMGKMQQI